MLRVTRCKFLRVSELKTSHKGLFTSTYSGSDSETDKRTIHKNQRTGHKPQRKFRFLFRFRSVWTGVNDFPKESADPDKLTQYVFDLEVGSEEKHDDGQQSSDTGRSDELQYVVGSLALNRQIVKQPTSDILLIADLDTGQLPVTVTFRVFNVKTVLVFDWFNLYLSERKYWYETTFVVHLGPCSHTIVNIPHSVFIPSSCSTPPPKKGTTHDQRWHFSIHGIQCVRFISVCVCVPRLWVQDTVWR